MKTSQIKKKKPTLKLICFTLFLVTKLFSEKIKKKSLQKWGNFF